MSDDQAYARALERDNAAAMRKAEEIAFANQVNQLGQLKAASPQPAPKKPEYLELPERELPSTAPELRQELEVAIVAYRKAIENVRSFEINLQEARRAEAVAVTDDGGDEKKIVKAVSESQGLQAVYSRRLELAGRKVPEAFVAIVPVAKALAVGLVNRCVGLAAERADRHRAVFRPRLDHETFIRTFPSGFPVDFESGLDKLVGCAPDVINARACIPQFSFLGRSALPANLTFQQLQLDLDALERAEVAYQAEADRQYDFEAPAETEPQTA